MTQPHGLMFAIDVFDIRRHNPTRMTRNLIWQNILYVNLETMYEMLDRLLCVQICVIMIKRKTHTLSDNRLLSYHHHHR